MRLYAIDAPEMPGACRPERQCTPGAPFAARDHLRALTAGKTVACRQIDLDRYGRKVVQCFVDDIDLSCAMVRTDFAIERYGNLPATVDKMKVSDYAPPARNPLKIARSRTILALLS
ncbi:thermonuclease family protein [Rhizorhabdus wittichii]|uniref:Thermonuclease family protein n=1 Tax=Rhizorhabdus wittichii TaxID=160791 RepID=A0A975D2K4_9SPHN|nr:thermonuclease family protein [Rhizorhabdus wittichii]